MPSLSRPLFVLLDVMISWLSGVRVS